MFDEDYYMIVRSERENQFYKSLMNAFNSNGESFITVVELNEFVNFCKHVDYIFFYKNCHIGGIVIKTGSIFRKLSTGEHNVVARYDSKEFLKAIDYIKIFDRTDENTKVIFQYFYDFPVVFHFDNSERMAIVAPVLKKKINDEMKE